VVTSDAPKTCDVSGQRAAALPPSNLPPQAGEGILSDAFVRRVSFPILAVIAAVWIYSAFELRPLFADGFLYFLRILERRDFWLEAPARRSVDLVRQLPVLAALKLGIGDSGALAVVFGLSLALLPLALVCLCWPVLPHARKSFFVFPLLHYMAGALATGFAAINEGAAAAAWFWLLLFLLLFRPARGGWLAATAALALGTVQLHEGMVLLAPVLAAAALWRRRRETGRGARIALGALALWFAIVAAVQADFLVDPSRPDNRAAYFTALFSLWWLFGLWGSLNLPALFGIAGLVLLLVVWLGAQARAPKSAIASRLVWTAFGMACVAAVIDAIAADRIYAAQAQMNARNHPILISLPLAIAAFYAAAKPGAARRLPFHHAYILCALLAAAGALWHVETVRRWSDYLGVFRGVLRDNRGLVAWADVAAKLAPAERHLFEGMSHFWIEPAMSIALAPGGEVAVIVAARHAAGWYPFDARKPEELPRARFWSYEAYLAALNRR
jgi:hypothetical protein